MKLLIDAMDGSGPVDFTDLLAAGGGIEIVRRLNAPSQCVATLAMVDPERFWPGRRSRVRVMAEDGSLLFTGYTVAEAQRVPAGEGCEGAIVRAELRAESDECLLDAQGSSAAGDGLAMAAGQLLKRMTESTVAGLFDSSGVSDAGMVGVVELPGKHRWSDGAAVIAEAGGACYRVLDGALSLRPLGQVAHSLAPDDLVPGRGKAGERREGRNEIVATGGMEPREFVTELFSADGSTSTYVLSTIPFYALAADAAWMEERFDGAGLNSEAWQLTDAGAHISISGAGLTVAGGTGVDGATTLVARRQLELGGTVLVEAREVQPGAGSDGVFCGLYTGPVTRAHCLAGFNVRQAQGGTVLAAMVNGVETGTTFVPLPGHRYTLRLQLHATEMYRVRQAFSTFGTSGVESFGGGLVPAAVDVVFEVRDEGLASNTPGTVLGSVRLDAAPAVASFALVNSVQLTGSVGACRVHCGAPTWVSAGQTGMAGWQPRLMGNTGEGADCTVSSAGHVTFFPGRVPGSGDLLQVQYRARGRAAGRALDGAAQAVERARGLPGVERRTVRVTRPPVRSSADCEAAALALLSQSGSDEARFAGEFETEGAGGGVWPGDLVSVSGELSLRSIVREVTLTDTLVAPETIRSRIKFAGGWAEHLGIEVEDGATAEVTAAALPLASTRPADLSALSVVNASGTALQLDAGADAPTGGGFEIRRRDGGFGSGSGPDLVLRTPVRSFTLSRTATVERVYVRMYDGATPANFSRFSSVVITNLPVG